MEAVPLIGIQATGKSSFFRARMFDTHVRLNLDMLRTRHREAILLRACIDGKARFVADNTNPTREERRRYVEPAREAGFVVVGFYFRSALEPALERNARREGRARVPDGGVRGTYGRLELPSYSEGFDVPCRTPVAPLGSAVLLMNFVDKLPHPVRVIEHVWIPMPDGVRLSAKIWLPEGAESEPVPAILEYIPYRKRDFTSARDAKMHPYVAGHGYACLRVDIRGSGDSEGLLADEYLERELVDGEVILSWIAAQPWCSGEVGIIGKSWGGFNGLQLAARRPPELGAVITVCSTDDRYADDVHYMGGCLLGDNQSWASAMLNWLSLPPDPLIVGDAWRDMWRQRLEGGTFWLEAWLEHQHRGDYWKHGSISEDYSAVEVPVFAISGWADGYSNAVFRLMRHLSVPRKALIGPWSHLYPHEGIPGPAVGFLQEAVRWWDRHLKGADNGVDAEPMLRLWMQEPVPPTMFLRERPGRWVAEPSWPSPNISERRFILGRGGLVREGREIKRRPLTIQSPLSVGLYAGRWCSFTATPDLPHDQREEDGGALVFQSIRLTEPIEICGAVRLEARVRADQPVAQLIARLSYVAPSDKATRITYGMLNLTHRDGHEHPKPLEPGKTYSITIDMNEVAQVVPAGHRLRLSLSTSYWPLAWPPPRPTRLTVYTADSALALPVRPPRPDDPALRLLGEPEATPPPPITQIEPKRYDWIVTRDLARDTSILEVIKDEGTVRYEDIDLEVTLEAVERFSYRVDDFNSVRGQVRGRQRLARGDWVIETTATTELTSSADEFHLYSALDAYEGDQRVYCRSRKRSIPRKLL